MVAGTDRDEDGHANIHLSRVEQGHPRPDNAGAIQLLSASPAGGWRKPNLFGNPECRYWNNGGFLHL